MRAALCAALWQAGLQVLQRGLGGGPGAHTAGMQRLCLDFEGGLEGCCCSLRRRSGGT